MKIRKWNLIQKTLPRSDKSSWCVCDRVKVLDGQKCTVCKRKSKTKHQKYDAGIAQMVEHIFGKDEDMGSSPITSLEEV